MADLSRRREPPSLRSLNKRLEDLEQGLAFLRSSRAVVARAEFPSGIIPAAALQQATAEPGLVSLTTSGFSLGTTATALLSANAVVPAGFNSCVVSLVGRVYAGNTTAVDGFLTAQVKVNGVTGNAIPVHVGISGHADDTALNVATCAMVINNLNSGDTVPVQLLAWTDAATWTADPANVADMTGSIVWFS